MPRRESFAKTARMFGTMLSIAHGKKERKSILDMIQETIENIHRTRPTFSRRNFIQTMAQAAYPNDPSRRLALIDEIRGLTTSRPNFGITMSDC